MIQVPTFIGGAKTASASLLFPGSTVLITGGVIWWLLSKQQKKQLCINKKQNATLHQINEKITLLEHDNTMLSSKLNELESASNFSSAPTTVNISASSINKSKKTNQGKHLAMLQSIINENIALQKNIMA